MAFHSRLRPRSRPPARRAPLEIFGDRKAALGYSSVSRQQSRRSVTIVDSQVLCGGTGTLTTSPERRQGSSHCLGGSVSVDCYHRALLPFKQYLLHLAYLSDDVAHLNELSNASKDHDIIEAYMSRGALAGNQY
jgi:hypothetical protein